MSRPRLTVVLFLLVGLLAGLLADRAAASPPAALPELRFEAPAELSGLAARLKEVDPARLLEVMRLAGAKGPGPPIRVILAPEGSGPAQSAPSWIAGYALPEIDTVVLLPARSPSYPDSSLEELLRHEVAHVLIARAAGGRPLPRWLQEGLATVAGGPWGIADETRIAADVLRGGPVSMARVEERFARGSGEIASAYVVSAAFIRDLLRRHGREVAATLLAEVAAGLPFDEAFRRATGETLEAAERAFQEHQTFWYRWVPLLTSSFALWTAILALAFFARRRRRQRVAELHRRWEEEERARAAAAAAAEAAEGGGPGVGPYGPF